MSGGAALVSHPVHCSGQPLATIHKWLFFTLKVLDWTRKHMEDDMTSDLAEQ